MTYTTTEHRSSPQFSLLLRTFVVASFVVSFVVLVFLTITGWIAPWTGRFYSLWDTGYAKIHSEFTQTFSVCRKVNSSSHHRICVRASTDSLAVLLLRP